MKPFHGKARNERETAESSLPNDGQDAAVRRCKKCKCEIPNDGTLPLCVNCLHKRQQNLIAAGAIGLAVLKVAPRIIKATMKIISK